MKSVLTNEIMRLPKGKVSDTETRYPQRPAEMRAFLIRFFTRHCFQILNSLVDYMSSEDFLDVVASRHLRILDVGSGPAVASLAITDMLYYILEYLEYVREVPRGGPMRLTHVLNDTSGICLGTGQHMLANYFRTRGRGARRVASDRIIGIQRAFPGNIGQLRRLRSNLGAYDIIVFSYVISPLDENEGFADLVQGLLNVEKLCRDNGRILIAQDKYETSLIRRVSRAIGARSSKQSLTQHVYPKRDKNETYTYTYYSCLYAPARNVTPRQGSIA
jgi:hypothetical protein